MENVFWPTGREYEYEFNSNFNNKLFLLLVVLKLYIVIVFKGSGWRSGGIQSAMEVATNDGGLVEEYEEDLLATGMTGLYEGHIWSS